MNYRHCSFLSHQTCKEQQQQHQQRQQQSGLKVGLNICEIEVKIRRSEKNDGNRKEETIQLQVSNIIQKGQNLQHMDTIQIHKENFNFHFFNFNISCSYLHVYQISVTPTTVRTILQHYITTM